jgi:2-hydroxychromene-2-carboxylate isomerase
MSRTLEFFFDYVSPYTYLANSQLAALDAEVIYRPMLLGALMQSVGNQPPARLAPRGKYLFKDVQRWADYYDVPYKMNPVFPMNTIKALRVALVAQDEGLLLPVHRALFEAVWVHELDVNDETVLAGIITEAGLSADAVLARIGTDEIKAKLKSNTDEAQQRGAFGAPTFFVGQEMFFGNDRMQFVREALDRLQAAS